MFSKIQKRMKGEKGFTLIELLVVIIIIAILAAIAIPTFLGQRQKAQDAAAKSLVRNAMTAIESTYVDTRSDSPTATTRHGRRALIIEPSITFIAIAGWVVWQAPVAGTADNEVELLNTSAGRAHARRIRGRHCIAVRKTFGVGVNKSADNS